MSKTKMREDLNKALAEYEKKGKRIKDCPTKAAANSKINGRPGQEYVEYVNEQSIRRMKSYGN